jgi:pantetheine-phosphate adenylyltransferase
MTVNTAVYPGSFDPVTLGHMDIIERSANVFGHLVVLIVENTQKQVSFTLEERKKLLEKATQHMDNVSIDTYQGLLIDYLRNHDYRLIIKGLRAISDFDYEFQMALTNKKLAEEIETMFMMTKAEYAFLSSSVVKIIGPMGGDISGMVPAVIQEDILARLKEKGEGGS